MKILKLLGRVPRAYYAQMLSLGGSALLTFGTAFLMSAEDRGELAIFMLICSVGSYGFGIGLPSEVLKLTSTGNERGARKLFAMQIPISIGLGLLVWALLFKLRPFPFLSDTLLALAILCAIVWALFNTLSWGEFGRKDYAFSTALRGLVPGATILISLPFLILTTASTILVAAAYFTLTSAALVLLLLRIPSRNTRSTTSQTLNIRKSLRGATGFYGAQLLTLGVNRLPVIAAGAWLSPEVTAVVSIAVSLAEIQASLPQMRSAITFSEASSSRNARFTRNYAIKAIAALVPGTALVVVSAFALSLLLPSEYSSLPFYVLVISPGVALLALAASAINLLALRNEYGWVIVSQLVGISVFALLQAYEIGSTASTLLIIWSVISSAIGISIIIRARRPHIVEALES